MKLLPNLATVSTSGSHGDYENMKSTLFNYLGLTLRPRHIKYSKYGH